MIFWRGWPASFNFATTVFLVERLVIFFVHFSDKPLATHVCITRSDSGSYLDPSFFPHLNVEFCQNLVQSLRAETLRNRVVNDARCIPFSPYCQPCCVFDSYRLFISFISLLDTTGKRNSSSKFKCCLAREFFFYLKQNAAVVNQLAVFPYAEFVWASTILWSPWAVLLV